MDHSTDKRKTTVEMSVQRKQMSLAREIEEVDLEVPLRVMAYLFWSWRPAGSFDFYYRHSNYQRHSF